MYSTTALMNTHHISKYSSPQHSQLGMNVIQTPVMNIYGIKCAG